MKKIKKILAIGILTIIITACSSSTGGTDYVYLCMGNKSIAYHVSSTCKGLTKCSTSLKTTTKDSAINYYHRKSCRFCCR
jgi:hypothetical protein